MDDSSLHYEEFAPAGVLGRHVRRIWRMTAPASAAVGGPPEPIIPDGCVEIVLNLGDPFVRHAVGETPHEQPRQLVAGQITSAIRIEASGRVDLWGIRFHPWAASAFLGIPGIALRDSIVSLGDANARLERLLAPVRDERSERGQRRALVAALTRHANRLRADDGVAGQLVSYAANAREPVTVRGLADFAGLSMRRVQSLFRDGVGLSPKQLLRITRFQRALALRRAHAELSWSAIAVRSGYFDQAHLIHDSRDIAGCTPEALLGGDRELTEAFLAEGRA